MIIKCCAWSLNHVWLFATQRTVAHQAPLSMGILQARILEQVAMPSSRGSSQPRDRIQVSCIAGGFFPIWATKNSIQIGFFFFFLMLPFFFLWNCEQLPLSITIMWLNRQDICCYKSQGTQWCTNLWSPLFWDVVSEWHHLRGWTVLKCGCTSQNPGFSHLPSLLQNIKQITWDFI